MTTKASLDLPESEYLQRGIPKGSNSGDAGQEMLETLHPAHPGWRGNIISRRALLLATCVWIFWQSTSPALPNSNVNGNGEIPATTSWTDIRSLGVEGRGWTDTKNFYDRLPARAEKLVRPPVWGLSRLSSGLYARFITDATNIYARWSLTSSNLAPPNMTAIGASGLDLYVKTDNGWRWAGVGQPHYSTNNATIIVGMTPATREFLIYLPLGNGVNSVEIGVPAGTTARPSPACGKGRRKPIVFYGTSILQGISASRPGMVHSAMLGRRFEWPTVNLGFSGQGRMEPELADLLAELDPAVYVLDCLPNMEPKDVAERIEPFVRRLRAAHPTTPIVLVEDRVYANAFLLPGRTDRHRKNHENLRVTFRNLQNSGVKSLHYVPGDALFGTDGEATVDGSHPTDLGYARQAEAFAKILGPLLRTD